MTKGHEQSETLIHLFVECRKVCDLWMNIRQWFELKTGIYITRYGSVDQSVVKTPFEGDKDNALPYFMSEHLSGYYLN